MALHRLLTRSLAAALLAASLGPIAYAQPAGVAVEYHHARFDHYFVTAFPDEIALLDSGGFDGDWKRTGESFPVWLLPPASTVPTCRFFTEAFAPKSSHFYTPYGFECEALKRGPTWTYEGVAFNLRLPEASGACAPGTSALYRLYNNDAGGAPNHRYTASRQVFEQMLAAGWSPEGLLPDYAFACIPSDPVSTDAAGIWVGSTDADAIVYGIVLPEEAFWLLYTVPGSNLIGGFVHGRGSFAGGSFAAADARDHGFVPPREGIAAAVSGTYVAGGTLRGRIATGAGSTAFGSDYQSNSRAPFDLDAASGKYTGMIATAKSSYRPATATVDGVGAIAGYAAGCTFVGMLRPRADFNVADVTVRFGGGTCDYATETVSGVVTYDAADHALYAVATTAGGESGFALIGVKP